MNLSEMMNKKVAGVPVLYLGAGAAVILGVVAWRMRPTPNTGDPVVDAGEAATDPVDPYDALATTGTVVVQPQTPVEQEKEEETNQTWGRAAAKWLVDNKITNYGSATLLVSKILEGSDLSYEEGQWRNKVFSALGEPPEPVSRVGISQPASKQFTPPGRHMVKGDGDNTFRQLSVLYYGRNDASSINLLQSGNSRFGETNGPFNVGEEIYVPAWREPTYYTATSTNNTAEKIGAVNGVPAASIIVINDGMTFPVTAGTKVRVR